MLGKARLSIIQIESSTANTIISEHYCTAYNIIHGRVVVFHAPRLRVDNFTSFFTVSFNQVRPLFLSDLVF